MRKIFLLLSLVVVATVLTTQPSPASANPLTGIVAISAGGEHTCALTTAGGVKCWGYNTFGKIGDGTQTNRTTPVDVLGLDSGVAAVSAGGGFGLDHACALTATGGVKCWGHDGFGELGVPPDEVEQCPWPEPGAGRFPCSTTPVDVAGLSSGVVAVAAGVTHTCAITSVGGVQCWGRNHTGQLGDGTTTNRDVPVDVIGLTSGAVALALGYTHSCALMATGNVKCWGSNSAGRLGAESQETCYDHLGTAYPCSTVPLDVCRTPDETGATCLEPLSGLAAVTAGGVHTCALATAGTVKCWGANENGELGDGLRCGFVCRSPVDVCANANCTTPLSGATGIAAGNVTAHTCAVLSSGGVKCWGRNPNGELGDGTRIRRTTAVDVCQSYENAAQQCRAILSGVIRVDAGTQFTCVLTAGGAVKCWGANKSGNLGDGTTENRLVPVDVLLTVRLTGDADCDRQVAGRDATLVLQLHAGLLPSLPCTAAADVNKDGTVDSVDAALILQYVSRLVPSLPS